MSCATVISPFAVLPADDVGRRRGWTDEEKIRIVEESLRGFRQGSATARRYGLSRSLLSIWRRDYRRGVLGSSPGAAFMPVSVATSAAPPGEVSPPSQAGDDARIEITLKNGRRVAMSAHLDPNVLARLLPVLDAS
jgi:transposase